eukprot:359190-Chlamydomonas_euryale.AAC.6
MPVSYRCRTGLYLLAAFCAMPSGAQVERGTQLAQERGLSNVSFQVMDALKMTFPDDSFDLVWACESGEHMPDVRAPVDAFLR